MIFLDSSFIIALKVEEDQHHERALEISKDIGNGKYGDSFISDYIFDESITVIFSRAKNLMQAIRAGDEMFSSFQFLKMEDNCFKNAWKIFKSQKSPAFSFTDCTILAMMENKNISNLATFDKDFKKIEGINVLS